MPSTLRSPLLNTSCSPLHIAFGSLIPFWITRTTPRFSATSRRPSGVKAIAVGLLKPAEVAAFSTAKSGGAITARAGLASHEPAVARHAIAAFDAARRRQAFERRRAIRSSKDEPPRAAGHGAGTGEEETMMVERRRERHAI